MKHLLRTRLLLVTLLFALCGLPLLLLPLSSSAFALIMTPTRRGPTATPNCSEMPCEMVSPPPGVRATRTSIFKLPTNTVVATRPPRNQPSATPNLDELGAPATTSANVRPLAGLSSLASISVAAGDVNGLANAVNAVNAGTADTIFLSPGTYNMNGAGPFVFNTNVTIEGNGAIIEGGLTSQRVFSFRLGTVASIAHLTIRHAGGPNRSYGGAIGSRATLSIYDSVFDSNQALDGGGAIINAGTLNIYRTTFTGNSAGSGGAIQNEKGYLNIVCSRFLNNTADTGSILAAHGYSISVHKSRFTGNTSTIYGGGAIYRLAETPNTTFDVNGDNFWHNGGLPPVSDGPSVDSVSTGISVTSAASSDPTLNAECLQQATVVPTQAPVPTVTPIPPSPTATPPALIETAACRWLWPLNLPGNELRYQIGGVYIDYRSSPNQGIPIQLDPELTPAGSPWVYYFDRGVNAWNSVQTKIPLAQGSGPFPPSNFSLQIVFNLYSANDAFYGDTAPSNCTVHDFVTVSANKFKDKKTSYFNKMQTAAHEVGHAIGLGHIQYQNMAPPYPPNPGVLMWPLTDDMNTSLIYTPRQVDINFFNRAYP